MIFGKRKINKFLLSAMFLVAVFLLFSKVNAQVNTLDFQETFSKPYNGTLQHDEWNMLLGTTTDQMFDSSGNPYGFFLSTLYPSITKGQLGINIIPGTGSGGTTLKARSFGGNILGLYDNTGSEVFTVLNNGNMGLGTTNPSQKIDVNGIVKATAVVSTGVTSHPTGIGPYVETYVYSGDTGRLFTFDGSSYYDLAIGDWNSGNPNIMLKTGGNVGINRGNPSYKLDVAGTLRTDNGANLATVSGNIGIGTTAPATKLHVVGGGSAIVRNDTMSFNNDYDLINKGYLESVIPDIIASSTSSSTDLFWQGSLTGNISNSNSGNVGIGTSNPSQALDVAGNIKLATTLLSDSNLGIKSAATIKFLDNTNTELLTILQSGNVGIGVSNPANKLTIASSDDKDSGPIISLAGTSANQTESGRIRFTEIDISQSPYYQGAYIHYNGSSNTLNIGVHNNADALTSSDTDVISLQRSTGNVGIGTTTPSKLLTLAQPEDNNGLKLFGYGSKSGSYGEFYIDTNGWFNINASSLSFFSVNGSTKASFESTKHKLTNNYPLVFGWSDPKNYGIGYNSTYDRLEFMHSQTMGTNVAMVLDANSNVGIGTTAPATKLHVVGGGSAIVRNDTMSFDNDYDLINLGYLNSALNDVMIPVTPILDNAFIQNGNSFNAKAILGTNDSFDLGFETAGSEKMTILANGNVGIGTTNPGAKLDIRGGNLRLSNGEGSHSFDLEYTNSESLYFHAIANDINAIAMTINYAGNIGIGTTAPATKLHVVGGGSAIVRNDTMSFDNDYDLINLGYLNSALNDVMIPVTPILDNAFIQNGNSFNAKAILGTNDSFDLGFKTAGSEKMTILANGNVGIGTTNPLATLNVDGTLAVNQSANLTYTSYSHFAQPNLSTTFSNENIYDRANYDALSVGLRDNTMGNSYISALKFLTYDGGTRGARIIYASPSATGISSGLHFYEGAGAMSHAMTMLNGRVGIGTTAPATKLHVVGGGSAIVRNDTMSFSDDYDLINKGYLESVIPDIIASSTSSIDYFWDGDVSGNIFNLNSGNIGIGTNNPSSLLTIANNNWISAIDGSGASSINMFKVNTSNQIEVGAPLLIGPLEFAPDSGLLSFIDMPVTSASLSGTPHGYSLRLDGNNLLSIYGESNGSGGIVNSAVGVGIATPQYGKLEVRNTLGNINTGITLYAGTGTTARSWIGSGDQWHLTRGTDSSYGITILNSGHTAVKGTNPVAAFEILGGSHARNSTVSYTGNQYELVNVALLNTRIGDSVFWSGSQTGDISNTNTGNVGIGAAANSSFKLNIGGSVAATGASLSGQLVMTGSGVDANISGVNKLTAYTIDPLYNIEGVNYSTYAAAIVGGVKEEYLGKLKIDEKVVIDGEEQYQAEIDFTNVEKGSDAWVWYQVVDFSKDHVDVSYIPYGNFASVYYIMTDDKIIFRSDREAEISFRITGSRYDWKKWPTIAIDQNEKGWEVNRD